MIIPRQRRLHSRGGHEQFHHGPARQPLQKTNSIKNNILIRTLKGFFPVLNIMYVSNTI